MRLAATARTLAALIPLVAASLTLPARAETAMSASLSTNQAWLEDLARSRSMKIDTVEQAFATVFSKLPERVKVYPTENYYYYTLAVGGVIYAGNLRLAAQDRDTGLIHFAYFAQANAANDSGEMAYKAFGADDGVTVKKAAGLVYRVTFKGKTVTFELNDVSGVRPPPAIVADGEDYLGQVADESGIRFYLFYNRRLKVFAYVLDEREPVLDELNPVDGAERILIGHRTGFAFYRHHHLDRKVLIGVHEGNTVVNNAYDGPADQLPENHIVDDNLRKAIVDSHPDMKDQLDGFGYLKSGEGRYLIAPYAQYGTLEELAGFAACAESAATAREQYDGCFVVGE